jgi:WD40 repeat protein
MPGGEAILVGTEEGEVFVLHLATGRRDRGPELEGGIASVAVSPDGRLAAALTEGPALYLWELAPGGWRKQMNVSCLPRRASGYLAEPGRLEFAPDGRVVALAAGHGCVCTGLVEGGELARVFTAPRGRDSGVGCVAAAFLPDGRLLAAYSAGTDEDEGYGPYAIWVWDVATGEELLASPPQQAPISALAFSPDGRILASGSWDATVLLWDLSADR